MQGASILIIEDDEVLRDLIGRNLRARGHEVRVAGDVQDALTELRLHHFDLVLLDINLPDQTGWDILRTAQSEGALRLEVGREVGASAAAGPRLPVVVLSAVRVSPSRLAEFHPLAYLPKPFPMEALLRLAAEAALRRQTTDGAVGA